MLRKALLLFCLAAISSVSAAERPPNVLLIITDDQGYGDLGLHGNEKIRTPNLDRLGGESVQLTHFHVSPVCSPTRASLLTGRYHYRTGVVDTYLGRSMMWPDEVTLAEMLSHAGYRTGLFGKWHLGDNYPMRAQDQGFQEVLVGRGGGLSQPSDEPGTDPKTSYFDPVLQHNGKAEKFTGYCTDIFADATMKFIEANREQPFFAMLATNAPHTPLQVPESYLKPYLDAGLPENLARVYAMVTNLDDNIGRVLEKLRALDLERNTIVFFVTDNGPQGARFNAGMRGTKGTVYEGGIRVPCFVRWTGTLAPGKVDRLSAHIDITPTLLDACSVPAPADLKIDGTSLLPLLRNLDNAVATWPERTLHFQWHRGDFPEPFRQSAALTQNWKLVNGRELYNLEKDPAEKIDVATKHPEIAAKLHASHAAWFAEVTPRTRKNPPPIVIGTPFENPTLLTRQDWRGPKAGWTQESIGHWEVNVADAGQYSVTLIMPPSGSDREARLKIADTEIRATLPAGKDSVTFPQISLPSGKTRVEPVIAEGDRATGVHYARIERLPAS